MRGLLVLLTERASEIEPSLQISIRNCSNSPDDPPGSQQIDLNLGELDRVALILDWSRLSTMRVETSGR
jgi:hypothetical protein